MGDNLRFFSSQSPDSSHGHGNTPDTRGPEFAAPWEMEPGAYGPDAHIGLARAEMQRLISTDGPKTSWLYSDYYSQRPKGGNYGPPAPPLARPATLQRKLTVGSPPARLRGNDPLEREADAVADRVMRNPKDCYLNPPVSPFRPFGQRKTDGEDIARQGAGEQEEEAVQLKSDAPEFSRMTGEDEEMQYKSMQRNLAGMDDDAKETLGYTHAFEKSDEEEDMGTRTSLYMRRDDAASPEGGTVSPELQQRIEGVRNSGGEKLPESEREFFESRMGHDFGDVRIHTGSEAAQVSHDVNAKAFTIGRDVVFGEGEYKPGTPEGRGLMAHELTHTVQQGAATSSVGRKETKNEDEQSDEFNHPITMDPEEFSNEIAPELEYFRVLNALDIPGNSGTDLAFAWMKSGGLITGTELEWDSLNHVVWAVAKDFGGYVSIGDILEIVADSNGGALPDVSIDDVLNSAEVERERYAQVTQSDSPSMDSLYLWVVGSMLHQDVMHARQTLPGMSGTDPVDIKDTPDGELAEYLDSKYGAGTYKWYREHIRTKVEVLNQFNSLAGSELYATQVKDSAIGSLQHMMATISWIGMQFDVSGGASASERRQYNSQQYDRMTEQARLTDLANRILQDAAINKFLTANPLDPISAAAFYQGGHDQFDVARAEGEIAGQVILDVSAVGFLRGIKALRLLSRFRKVNSAAFQRLQKSAPPFQPANPSLIRKYYTDKLVLQFKKSGGKTIYSNKPHKSNSDVVGTYQPKTNTITLYPGYNSGTLAEELLHFAQAKQLGWIGKSYRALAKQSKMSAKDFMDKIVEAPIEGQMLKTGFRKTQLWDLK